MRTTNQNRKSIAKPGISAGVVMEDVMASGMPLELAPSGSSRVRSSLGSDSIRLNTKLFLSSTDQSLISNTI